MYVKIGEKSLMNSCGAMDNFSQKRVTLNKNAIYIFKDQLA